MSLYSTGGRKVFFDENGAALLQVVFVGGLLAILAYMTTLLMSHSDHSNMRTIHRNENLTYSNLLADQISDKTVIRNLATVSSKDGAGAARLFQ